MYRLNRTFGANVEQLRKEQRLKKSTLAIMGGISRPYLNSIVNGDSDVRLSCVQNLADALCVDPVTLLVARQDDGEPT